MTKTTKVKKECPITRFLTKRALVSVGKSLVKASACEKAGDRILYHLPGVFSFSIRFGEACVRLIKEANAFRIMENSEKSDVLLCLDIKDRAALSDLSSKRATLQSLLAEGRLGFVGKTKYAALIIGVAAEGDKTLPTKTYQELYGE